jgi:hypothetical protein
VPDVVTGLSIVEENGPHDDVKLDVNCPTDGVDEWLWKAEEMCF